MDSSTFQMFTACYSGVIKEDFDALIGILCFGRNSKGLCDEWGPRCLSLGEVEVVRTKSSGAIDIGGEATDGITLKESFEIHVPKIEGQQGESPRDAESFGIRTKRDREGDPITPSRPVGQKELLRNLKKELHFTLTTG